MTDRIFMPDAFKRLYETPREQRTGDQQTLVDAVSEVWLLWHDAEAKAAALEEEIEPLRAFYQDVLNRSVVPA
jgi:hypothetical protein